ncbi:MAG: SDR family oxidoreductase [Rhodospirillales bacterium]|nr:SDR family oxidoreductase [Rhodospirillales bacterium]
MSTLFDLSGKAAIVTGASRGIGRAIALRLAQHGALVTVSSRHLDACEAVVGEIAAAGGRARAQACHIGRKEDLAALAERSLAAWGGIDILVCNAAINPHFGPSATIGDDAFDRTLASNVRSNFWLANMVLPGMAERGGGAVIVVSSIAGLRGSASLGAYAISKAADLQLVRNIAVEWGPRGIRANAIAPGLVRTDFARALWEDPLTRARRERETPLKRLGEPDEIAGAAVFLASPAASFMTGQTLVIDGGLTAGPPADV